MKKHTHRLEAHCGNGSVLSVISKLEPQFLSLCMCRFASTFRTSGEHLVEILFKHLVNIWQSYGVRWVVFQLKTTDGKRGWHTCRRHIVVQ